MRDVARIFISHAWSGLILETLASVKGQLPDEESFIWIDCCSVNQHEVLAKSPEWYATTFHEAISKIGLTCLVLTPVLSPISLKRSWCLWEIFGTIKTSTELRICIPDSQKQILTDMMSKDFSGIIKAICSVDAEMLKHFILKVSLNRLIFHSCTHIVLQIKIKS